MKTIYDLHDKLNDLRQHAAAYFLVTYHAPEEIDIWGDL